MLIKIKISAMSIAIDLKHAFDECTNRDYETQ